MLKEVSSVEQDPTDCDYLAYHKVASSRMFQLVAHPRIFRLFMKGHSKDIQIILRLFLVIAMYFQVSSSQIKSITQFARGVPACVAWCSSVM